MMAEKLSDQAIFDVARKLDAPEARQSYLQQICGDDSARAQHIEALLYAHDESSSFLEGLPPGISISQTIDQPGRECAGMRIGPYKLLQQIGEGGMGTVFMAEQSEPVKRRVALKIIKPGMNTRQVIARFEAERQALAVMEHPNIARVLEAGSTESGQPYFVMELVRGVPITTYCDQNNLPVRERLQLFASVCQAIQHAHTKGIIHRDIKPTNVLVTSQDGQPVVKVIDFGVAKAMGQQLTEKTLFTEFAQMVGTPLYMSPEQAEMSSLDIDTRSDIYSLGVLLYELLTGSTPVDIELMRKAAFDEIRRIIREDEPPRPSTRIGDSDTLPAIAAHRHIEPARLSKLLRGELDWIVMMALEKDRSRRYGTASGLAADVERYLNDEAVQACPPSAWYRFRKFAKRRRSTLAATALLAISLLVALGGIASGIGWAVRDQTAREERLEHERIARQAKVSTQLELILDEVARLEQAERWNDALIAARRTEPVLAAGEVTPDLQQRVRETLADLELVRRLDEIRMLSGTPWGDASERQQLAVRANREYAAALRQMGVDVDELTPAQTVAWIKSRPSIAASLLPSLDDWVAVRSVGEDRAALLRLTEVLHSADPNPWRRQMRSALTRRDWPALSDLTAPVELDRQPAATLSFFAAALHLNGKHQERDLVLMRAQANYPTDFWISHRLGVNLIWGQSREQQIEGVGYMRVAVAVRPESSHALMNLGNGYAALGQHDDAITWFHKAIERAPRNYGCFINLGIAFRQKGAYEEAIAAFERAIEYSHDQAAEAFSELSLIHSSSPDSNLRNARRAEQLADKAVALEPHVGEHWTALGIARYRQGQSAEAHNALEEALRLGRNGNEEFSRLPASFDWLVLAMSNWQQGEKVAAQRCYARAVEATAKQNIVDERLLKIQAEAEELLEMTGSPEETAEHLLARANRYNDRAIELKTSIRLPEAEAAIRIALRWKQQLVAEFPTSQVYKFHLAHAYLGLGYILQDLSRHSEARRALGEAATILNGLSADDAAGVELQQWVAHAQWQLGDSWLYVKQFDAAQQAYKKGLATFERLELSDPAQLFYRQQQISGYWKLAHLMLSSRRAQDAAAHYRRVVELYETIAFESPQKADYRNDLAGTLASLGLALEVDQRYAEAEDAHGRAIALWTQLSDDSPDDEWYRRERAYFSLRLASSLLAVGRPGDAVEHCRTSVRLHEELLLDFPDSPDYRPRLAESRGVMISSLSSLGRDEETAKEIEALLNANLSADDLNGIARTIVSRSCPSVSTAGLASELAKKAVRLNATAGHMWNTLGVALYRARNWKDAIAALEKSCEFRHERVSADFFFLAMSHWQLDQKEEARRCFDEAARWAKTNGQDDQEIGRFQAEAEELMKDKDGIRRSVISDL